MLVKNEEARLARFSAYVGNALHMIDLLLFCYKLTASICIYARSHVSVLGLDAASRRVSQMIV